MNKKREIYGIKVFTSNETYNKYKGTLQEQIEDLTNILYQIEAIIYDTQLTGIEARLKIQEILEKWINENMSTEYEDMYGDYEDVLNKLKELKGKTND